MAIKIDFGPLTQEETLQVAKDAIDQLVPEKVEELVDWMESEGHYSFG